MWAAGTEAFPFSMQKGGGSIPAGGFSMQKGGISIQVKNDVL